MKKHLLTAALAIVAIGGVFAMKADQKLVTDQLYYKPTGPTGPCVEIPNCTITPGPTCIDVTGVNYFDSDCRSVAGAFQRL